MSLKHFIDKTAQKQASNAFRNMGLFRKTQVSSSVGSLAKIASVENGQYVVYMPDGTFKSFTPNGTSRGLGVGSVIYVLNDTQIF